MYLKKFFLANIRWITVVYAIFTFLTFFFAFWFANKPFVLDSITGYLKDPNLYLNVLVCLGVALWFSSGLWYLKNE